MLGKSENLMLFLVTASLISVFAAVDISADEPRILGGQVYASSHRSTPEEFARRKELYKELISLRNANRQSDSITLNMNNYRAIMESIWSGAKEVYRGLIRPIPICGELIPVE